MWKRISHSLALLAESLADFLFPRYCTCCRDRLSLHERVICASCLLNLPRLRHGSFTDNDVARTFWGLFPIERGTAWFHYPKNSGYSRMLADLKYHNHPEIGDVLGRIMAEELLPKGFFDGIELIVPVPLAREKEKQRGYNQSAHIATGISQVTGIDVDAESVCRIVANPSQTKLTEAERRENVRGIFAVVHPERLENRHILLLDDVMTTGSTLCSCAETIAAACPVRISILRLARGGQS